MSEAAAGRYSFKMPSLMIPVTTVQPFDRLVRT
jgi:hypothetical protein